MPTQDRSYEVIENDGVIRVVLHDPSAIVRCSPDELFDRLRPYAPATDGWVSASGTLSVEFPADPRRSIVHLVSIVISSAFAPRSRVRLLDL